MRFAMFGAGFWSRYQLAAWREIAGVECVALYNRSRRSAESLAREFGIAAVYDDPGTLLCSERLDFIDIVTHVSTHPYLVALAAAHQAPVICQKPMASTLAGCEQMVSACRDAGVPFLIHENWRWQAPLRRLKELLCESRIGEPTRARFSLITGFDVFANQPSLAAVDQCILSDLGSHLLDIARFLFGEVESVYCCTRRVHPNIRGEDLATVLLQMHGRPVHVVLEMAYAGNSVDGDSFPETLAFVEGSRGMIELRKGFELRVTDQGQTQSLLCPPPDYSWADPAYGVVHASIVPAHRNLFEALRGGQPAETAGEDNLKTMRLVFAAYESAQRNEVVHL